MGRATKRVWFLVVPGTGVLDIAGPWEVLGHANDVLGRPAVAPAVHRHRVTASTGEHASHLGTHSTRSAGDQHPSTRCVLLAAQPVPPTLPAIRYGLIR